MDDTQGIGQGLISTKELIDLETYSQGSNENKFTRTYEEKKREDDIQEDVSDAEKLNNYNTTNMESYLKAIKQD